MAILRNKLINRLSAGTLMGLAVLPFLLWPAVLNRYGVSFPIEDQWDTPYHAIIEAFAGRFNLETYFVQHNEARKVLPTAISVAFAMLRGR
ncbi:MAG: hypothetical protein N3A55_06785 [Methylohalobius sp.]|nr:hypothetical protein [Methylohalobius sp.]